MKVIVTGGGGFIGSNLTDALLEQGHQVVVLDNFSTGRRAFLPGADAQVPNLRVVDIDLFDEAHRVAGEISGADAVVHLAANADVRFGWQHPQRDIEQNLVVTQTMLEACRAEGVDRFLFSSTGSVYGEAQVIPTPESCPFPVQTSLYGASKAAAEGLLGAYAEGADMSVTVFRFVSVMGARYTHGHVIDFMRRLRSDPTRLEVLGNGEQRKSYMDVTDCVAAVVSRLDARPAFEVFNLGTDEYCTVRDSIGWITGAMGLQPTLEFTGGDRGWVGDNPFIWLDTSAITATGWTPRFTIKEAVERTVDYLLANVELVDEYGIELS